MYKLRLWTSVVLFCALIARNNIFFDLFDLSHQNYVPRELFGILHYVCQKNVFCVITFYWTCRKCEFVLSLFFDIYLPCYNGDRPGGLKRTQQLHLLLCSVNHRTLVCHVPLALIFRLADPRANAFRSTRNFQISVLVELFFVLEGFFFVLERF